MLFDLLILDKTAFFLECMYDICVHMCVCYIFWSFQVTCVLENLVCW